MPRLMVGAVWMLGSRPSVTEDEVTEVQNSGKNRVKAVARTHQIMTCDPSSTTRFAGRRK
ncbi:CTP:molybdopterin cytidylyltransferase MocA [Rhizobium lentis]|uniref:CTP:molybdopterin cytidylyltransferase MocA n=1 Tax=Rhizobium lentis TaxID=1138194 RepID=A0A7W8XHH6_9HYPH|nr:CTP:molybdopterin cytidylyltransferase MocA [Rhizobium lentis]MBB5552418.1 CTP:molybdopterin cytidylyltransferase MocA [Rhizobium lentis]MBB5562972.1 CTP:molybdopterin cytidylyltransferase MocA [Rhizobium lentis]MBB5569235.1 CTP:molybdopterin cytidylyltransferase MocA [Rhizobium lentis]